MVNNDFDEQQTQVERLVEELENATLTLQNYKVYSERVNSSVRIIKAQIENLITDYKALKRKLDDKLENNNVKRSMEEGYVPIEVFELLQDINEVFKNAYSWKMLENKLNNLIFQRLFLILDEAKALDIKREALAEMREMENKRNELFLESIKRNNALVQEVINSRLKVFDEKFINAIRMIADNSNAERKQFINLLSSLNTGFNIDELEKLFDKSKEEIISEIKKISTPVEPVMLVDEEQERRSDKKEEDFSDDLFDDDDDDNDEVLG